MALSTKAALMATQLAYRLADPILEEVKTVTCFKEDFEFLCQELVYIESLLNELREKRTNLSSMRNWIEKFEDFVEDATDMVEECREEFRVGGNGLFPNLFFRFSMGCKIRELKKRLTRLHGDSKYLKYLSVVAALDVNDLDLKNIEEQREISTSLITESQIVGMEPDIERITHKLSIGEDRKVIAIVGMGGLGKTLLAQQLYDRVSSSFDHAVWLHVSQKYDRSKLLDEAKEQIYEQILPTKRPGEAKEQIEEQIKEQILPTKRPGEAKEQIEEQILPTKRPGNRNSFKDYIKGKRLLIVLDDVWNVENVNKIVDDTGFDRWNCKKKYIITSRNKIRVGVNDYTHEMMKLQDEVSLSLFCIHAFPNLRDHTPRPELEPIVRGIVSKCAGLPLALKTVGRSMASVMLPNDWKNALDHLHQAAPLSDGVMLSLKLSYHALPSHLKPCFVYCSYFPKGADINSECLVHGWIAQGLISCKVLAEEAYDLGKSYMYGLIDRCLLEISDVDEAGRPVSLKMHDLLHQLALSLEQTKCFLGPVGDSRKLEAAMCRGSRGISLMKDEIDKMEEDIHCPGLRTLLLRSNSTIKSIHDDFFKNMKYLTVLDLSSTCISSLPPSVQNLKHLKFFNLSHTDIDVLPEFLSDLKYLQFLDVSYCNNLTTLHTGIGKHQSLLHLNMEESLNINLFPVGISKLTSLHTLIGVEVSVDGDGRSINEGNADALKLQDLQGLKLLQHLVLLVKIRSVDDARSFIRLEKGIFGGMTKMRTLVLRNIDQMTFLRLPKDMEVMQGLETVRLDGCETPTWIFELKSIMGLDLNGDRCCKLSQCKRLAQIPHLKSLAMWDNSECSKFPKEFGEPSAFPDLLSFQVVRFEGLRKFPRLHEKAMPRLKRLEFYWCNRLTDMPNGIENLQSLEEVTVNIRLPRQDIKVFREFPCWKSLEERKNKEQRKIKVRLVTKPEDGDGDEDEDGDGGVQGGLEDEDEDEGVQGGLEDENGEDEYHFKDCYDSDESAGEGEGFQGGLGHEEGGEGFQGGLGSEEEDCSASEEEQDEKDSIDTDREDT